MVLTILVKKFITQVLSSLNGEEKFNVVNLLNVELMTKHVFLKLCMMCFVLFFIILK
jgi:hypothetical protein